MPSLSPRARLGAVIVGLALVAALVAVIVAPRPEPAPDPEGAVGIVRISGPIMAGGGATDFLGQTLVGSDAIARQLRQAREDESIKAVLVRLNSPGGTAAASQEIMAEMEKLAQEGKPVVVSMADVAASGGYMIAAHAHTIVANPGTMTGSIGVIIQTEDWSDLYELIGIDHEAITSGPYKDMGTSTRPLTDEEREIFQGMVQDVYDQFVEDVARGRDMEVDEMREVADGRIFTGRQALELGLVDRLGTYQDSLDLAAELGGLEEPYEVREIEPPPAWQRFFLSLDGLIPGLPGPFRPAGLLQADLPGIH